MSIEYVGPSQINTTIQAAIDALPASGGMVQLDPGVYTENIVFNKAVDLIGCAPMGPGWVNGQPGVVIQAKSGTVIDIGSPASILDPGCSISGVQIQAPDDGVSLPAYGLRVRRMRGLTLRDIQFRNFRAGRALCLDGAGGYNEWAHLDNVNFSICSTPITLINATGVRIFGGALLNPMRIPGSVGIQTSGLSDTLFIYGTALLEFDTYIDLNGSPNEMSQIHGVRIENHINPAAVGINCQTSNNVHSGSFYGLGTGIEYGATAGSNLRSGCRFSACAKPVVDKGTGNS